MKIECGVCYEESNNNIFFNCKHSLCDKCYRKLKQQHNIHNCLPPCPFCRETIQVKQTLKEILDCIVKTKITGKRHRNKCKKVLDGMISEKYHIIKKYYEFLGDNNDIDELFLKSDVDHLVVFYFFVYRQRSRVFLSTHFIKWWDLRQRIFDKIKEEHPDYISDYFYYDKKMKPLPNNLINVFDFLKYNSFIY